MLTRKRNHIVTPLFIQATAIALVVTMVVVFNAETLAWPIRRLRFSISHNARGKMEKTSNVFPVKWTETIVRIKEAEELDILHVNEMPKRPRSKLIYLVFLMIYTLIDFPAARIAIAYESIIRIDVISVDRVILIAGRLIVAIFLLPIFIAIWFLLALWNLLFWVGRLVFYLPVHNWHELQRTTDQKLLEQLARKHEINRPAEPETAKDSEKEKGGNRRRSIGGAPAQDGAATEAKKKQERSPQDRAEEERRNARKEKEERMKQHVTLLVNPPKLYEHLRRKDSTSNEDSTSIDTSAAASSPAKEHRFRLFASELIRKFVPREAPKTDKV